MPAYVEEIDEAEIEGVKIHTLVAPKTIMAKDGKACRGSCARMPLGKFDRSGRRRPEPITGSDFVVDADMVIAADRTGPDLSWMNGDGVKADKAGTIEVNMKTLATARKAYSPQETMSGDRQPLSKRSATERRPPWQSTNFWEGTDMAPNAFRDELLQMPVILR